MVLAMALGLARARASRRLESSPRSPDKRRGNRGLRGPRADNRSARLPQLVAVLGRRAGVIGLKRRRMSPRAVRCGRAESDLTPIGRRHAGRRTTGVARNADSVRGQASVRAIVPTGVAALVPIFWDRVRGVVRGCGRGGVRRRVESVLVEELEVGEEAHRQGRVAAADDHGPDEQLAFVDQTCCEGPGGQVRPADGEVAGGCGLRFLDDGGSKPRSRWAIVS
jgi:hypothetical protein